MEKLICDKCGFELTDVNAICRVLDGMEAWQEAQRNRGSEARGIFPCMYYFWCKGEMVFAKDLKKQRQRVQDNRPKITCGV